MPSNTTTFNNNDDDDNKNDEMIKKPNKITNEYSNESKMCLIRKIMQLKKKCNFKVNIKLH